MPQKIIMTLHTMFIILRILYVNFALNRKMTVDMDRKQSTESEYLHLFSSTAIETCIRVSISKKQARLRFTSKKMIINAVAYTFFRLSKCRIYDEKVLKSYGSAYASPHGKTLKIYFH